MDQVLSTPELLESILLGLPLRDLLVNAQRVNRHFKETIGSSPSLQQALFFLPTPAGSKIAPRFNPLLEAAFPPWFDKEGSKHWHCRSSHGIFEKLPWGKNDETAAAYARKGASWRRMLFMQPSTTTLHVLWRVQYRGGRSDIRAKRIYRQGVRMGALYDLVQRHCESKSVWSFTMFWQMPPNEKMDAADDNGHDIRKKDCGNHSGFGEDVEALRAEEDKGITLLLESVQQCCPDRRGSLESKFRSLGYGSEEAVYEPQDSLESP